MPTGFPTTHRRTTDVQCQNGSLKLGTLNMAIPSKVFGWLAWTYQSSKYQPFLGSVLLSPDPEDIRSYTTGQKRKDPEESGNNQRTSCIIGIWRIVCHDGQLRSNPHESIGLGPPKIRKGIKRNRTLEGAPPPPKDGTPAA